MLIGPNGAGKSTLLKAIAGERRLTAGEVRLHGKNIGTLTPRTLARLRAVLVQSPAIDAPFSVDEVVRLGVPQTTREATASLLVERGLATVGLAGYADRPITRLSGGEQQRVHAARVLVQLWAQPDDGRARCLLLDEPTSHLDPAHQLLILRLARAHATAGGGVLAILHDINLAAAIGDEIAAIHRGRIVAKGAPGDVLTTELLAELYGVPFEAFDHAGRRWIAPQSSLAVAPAMQAHRGYVRASGPSRPTKPV